MSARIAISFGALDASRVRVVERAARSLPWLARGSVERLEVGLRGGARAALLAFDLGDDAASDAFERIAFWSRRLGGAALDVTASPASDACISDALAGSDVRLTDPSRSEVRTALDALFGPAPTVEAPRLPRARATPCGGFRARPSRAVRAA